jgi:hypothetical protein
LTPSALAKQEAYVDVIRRLVGLADWTERSQAEAEEIIAELEKLLPVDPPDFLRVEINE